MHRGVATTGGRFSTFWTPGAPVTIADLDQSAAYWNRIAEGIHLTAKGEEADSPW